MTRRLLGIDIDDTGTAGDPLRRDRRHWNTESFSWIRKKNLALYCWIPEQLRCAVVIDFI